MSQEHYSDNEYDASELSSDEDFVPHENSDDEDYAPAKIPPKEKIRHEKGTSRTFALADNSFADNSFKDFNSFVVEIINAFDCYYPKYEPTSIAPSSKKSDPQSSECETLISTLCWGYEMKIVRDYVTNHVNNFVTSRETTHQSPSNSDTISEKLRNTIEAALPKTSPQSTQKEKQAFHQKNRKILNQWRIQTRTLKGRYDIAESRIMGKKLSDATEDFFQHLNKSKDSCDETGTHPIFSSDNGKICAEYLIYFSRNIEQLKGTLEKKIAPFYPHARKHTSFPEIYKIHSRVFNELFNKPLSTFQLTEKEVKELSGKSGRQRRIITANDSLTSSSSRTIGTKEKDPFLQSPSKLYRCSEGSVATTSSLEASEDTTMHTQNTPTPIPPNHRGDDLPEDLQDINHVDIFDTNNPLPDLSLSDADFEKFKSFEMWKI